MTEEISGSADEVAMAEEEDTNNVKTMNPMTKKYMIIWSIFTGTLLAGWFTMILLNSACDRPDLTPNFDTNRYTGVWYELKRSRQIPFESGECVTAEY